MTTDNTPTTRTNENREYLTAAQVFHPQTAHSTADSEADLRLSRVLAARRQPQCVHTGRDLKVLAITDDDCPVDLARTVFLRRPHRTYLSLRTKLLRLGLSIVPQRCFFTNAGRLLGVHSCLKLSASPCGDLRAKPGERRHSHPVFAEGVDQLRRSDRDRLFVRPVPAGISAPELHEYFDSKNFTSAASKRIRSVINTISKIQPTVERKHFEGSAMHHHISLQGENEDCEKRRKVGMTSLGERLQEIVMELLQ